MEEGKCKKGKKIERESKMSDPDKNCRTGTRNRTKGERKEEQKEEEM